MLEPIDITNELEIIQEAIIYAGGRFFKQAELKRMSVEDLLQNIVVRNKVSININYKIRSNADENN